MMAPNTIIIIAYMTDKKFNKRTFISFESWLVFRLKSLLFPRLLQSPIDWLSSSLCFDRLDTTELGDLCCLLPENITILSSQFKFYHDNLLAEEIWETLLTTDAASEERFDLRVGGVKYLMKGEWFEWIEWLDNTSNLSGSSSGMFLVRLGSDPLSITIVGVPFGLVS